MEFSYVLLPKVPGKYNLGPIDVTINGQVFKTESLEIEVLGGSSAGGSSVPAVVPQTAPMTSVTQPQQPSQASFQPDDDNIFVKAWVDKTSLYPNEQILLTYSLYTRYDTRYEGFQEEPQVSGFWIEDFPMDREIPRQTVSVNGKRYVQADIKKVALFPTTAADYTIQPGVLKASIREEPKSSSMFDEFFNDSFFSGGGFFARRQDRLLKPPPINLTVKPFPEAGKPASFQGAVGNFRLSATADKQSLKQNEPLTVKLVVEGQGNIETLNKPPLPDLPQFKIYESDTSSELYKTGDVIGGRKTFEIVFIPTEPGKFKIPSLEFSFFNPPSGRYVTLKSPEFSLEVKPSDQTFRLPKSLSQEEAFKKEIQVEGRDILFIRENIPSEQGSVLFHLAVQGMAALNVLLTAMVFYGFWNRHRERIFARDEGLKRKYFARAQAEARMRKLKKFYFSRSEKSPMAYYEEIEKILTAYLADKFNLSAHGITRQELEATLVRFLGDGDPLYQSIVKFYQLCDESRFGKGGVPGFEKDEALKMLRQTLARVEHVRQ